MGALQPSHEGGRHRGFARGNAALHPGRRAGRMGGDRGRALAGAGRAVGADAAVPRGRDATAVRTGQPSGSLCRQVGRATLRPHGLDHALEQVPAGPLVESRARLGEDAALHLSRTGRRRPQEPGSWRARHGADPALAPADGPCGRGQCAGGRTGARLPRQGMPHRTRSAGPSAGHGGRHGRGRRGHGRRRAACHSRAARRRAGDRRLRLEPRPDGEALPGHRPHGCARYQYRRRPGDGGRGRRRTCAHGPGADLAGDLHDLRRPSPRSRPTRRT